VRQQARALGDAGLLERLVSSWAYPERGELATSLSWLDRLLGTRLGAATERRRLGQVPGRALSSPVWPEAWSRLGTRLGLVRAGPAAADLTFAGVDRAASRQLPEAVGLVLGREDSCLRTFRAARNRGAVCLYGLPTAYYRAVRSIMEREAAEFPGAWPGLDWDEEYRPARNRRKDAELAAADHVLVPSAFAAASLADAGVPPQQVSTIPFGCQPQPEGPPDGTARQRVVLYVGNLNLRKGTARLLRAWKRLGAHHTFRLRLIGRLELTPRFLVDYAGLYEHLPRMPRKELTRHYAGSYAFVMPAAAEGFAVVITEALSHGVPVIVSNNTGAGGFVTDGQEGLLYPFGDDDKLCAALDRVLSRPAEAAAMGQAAYALAQRWTWRNYREAFVSLVRRLLAERNGRR
jgi:glycosyltransferase involved in cell wall biosynthesis